ncbi:MAG TPA: TrmB family transcriptional regulator [Methanosarcina sp.]|nr:TrmB family transcriptional regulator [Methanosarcina sp.]
MQKTKLLKEIGLSAYESAVYLSLLKLGVSEASTIHKDAEVPYGKVYSILDSLVEKGLVEVQRSRPKKYKGVKPDIALDRIFKKKEFEVEKELETLKLKIDELKKILMSIPSLKTKDEIFWTTGVTEADIKKVVISLFSEAKESLCVVPHSLGMPVLTIIFADFVRLLERGVKVNMLVSPQFNNFVSFISNKDEKTVEVLKKKLEIRAVKSTNSYFGIVDNNLVILLQPHPLDRDRLVSVVKIWDAELAKSLRKEFEVMWKMGKTFELGEKVTE